MLKVVSFTVIIMLAGQNLIASEGSENPDVPKPQAVTDTKVDSNRANKKVNLNFEPFGIGPTGYSSHGLSVGYFLTGNSVLLLEITQDSYNLMNYRKDTENVERRSSVGIHYKSFFANSTYYKLGVNHRRGWLSSINYEASSTAVALSLGNQWQWENFTLGCDWIGYNLPISFYSSHSRQNFSSIGNFDGTVELLRFYLGASF